MTIDQHTLSRTALEHAITLLDEEWLLSDPVLAPVMPEVLGRGVGQDWHKAGTFRHHLIGVARTLTLWQQPDAAKLLGLLHSVYGNAQVDIVKFDPNSERGRVQALVGEEIERLIHLYCVVPRAPFVKAMLETGPNERGELTVPVDDQPMVLKAHDVAIFTVVTMADICEQWYSWQDDIYSGYPNNAPRETDTHWAASLWPGPMRPTAYRISQISRLGKALQHPALNAFQPMPTVFDGCQHELSETNEAAACALYWSVIQQNQPLVSSATTILTLEQATKLNPWVAEPYLLLAQLYLTEKAYDKAQQAAASGVHLLCCWGNTWDKRVGWDAWVSWGRILLQSAENRQWPSTLNKLNNVALKP